MVCIYAWLEMAAPATHTIYKIEYMCVEGKLLYVCESEHTCIWNKNKSVGDENICMWEWQYKYMKEEYIYTRVSEWILACMAPHTLHSSEGCKFRSLVRSKPSPSVSVAEARASLSEITLLTGLKRVRVRAGVTVRGLFPVGKSQASKIFRSLGVAGVDWGWGSKPPKQLFHRDQVKPHLARSVIGQSESLPLWKWFID